MFHGIKVRSNLHRTRYDADPNKKIDEKWHSTERERWNVNLNIALLTRLCYISHIVPCDTAKSRGSMWSRICGLKNFPECYKFYIVLWHSTRVPESFTRRMSLKEKKLFPFRYSHWRVYKDEIACWFSPQLFGYPRLWLPVLVLQHPPPPNPLNRVRTYHFIETPSNLDPAVDTDAFHRV